MNAAHTPTPRTDAFFDDLYKDVPDEMTELSAGQERDFARQLERELAEAQDRIDDLTATGIHSCSNDCKRPNCVLRRELAEARDSEASEARWAEQYKQGRDALARIGGKMRNVCPSACDDYVAEWDAALATLEVRGSNPAQKSPTPTP
jgi:hypothetical protein